MTQDMIEMAKKAGIPTGSRFVDGEVVECLTLEVQAFVKLVAANAWVDGYQEGAKEEREACAKVCDGAHPNTLPAMLGMQILARGDA